MEIAKRYKDEPVVAGYDLMNEPLPNFFRQYNNLLLPLYRRLIQLIRKIDPNHMIILEGVHWATDFSVFDSFTKQEAEDNIMLQFHKYWNNPDAESLQEFIRYSQRLNVPLFMGEGGENNCDWYTTVFPLYERLNISWSFWSYKKMACTNSPITFDVPEGWNDLINWIDAKEELSPEKAAAIFDSFLKSIRNIRRNNCVLNALKREVPITIPSEAFEACDIHSPRVQGAKLRMSEPASLIFENGKISEVDYKRYGGEEQPEEENLLLLLCEGDRVNYLFHTTVSEVNIAVAADGKGELKLSTGLKEETITVKGKKEYKVSMMVPKIDKNCLWVSCTVGSVKLDFIKFSYPVK
jgi:hypothetical protein